MSCPHCGETHPPRTLLCPRTGDSVNAPGPCGRRLDRYAVKRLLGVGGFGSVYVAEHVRTGAPVALKVLKRSLAADATMLTRFMLEARAVAGLGTEYVVQVLDAEMLPDGTAFIAMELLEGVDLKGLAATEGPLHPTRVMQLLAQVLEGLESAHAKGVVHRDMKPANVFVTTTPRGEEVAKVLDFGISRVVEEGARRLTAAGAMMGTPGYMAYEQFVDARDVDRRTDLYAVAVMAYELLAGKKPYTSERWEELMPKLRAQDHVPLRRAAPRLPVPVCAIVEKGMSRQRERRYQTAREMAAALRGVMVLTGPIRVMRGKKKLAGPDVEAGVATRVRDDGDTLITKK